MEHHSVNRNIFSILYESFKRIKIYLLFECFFLDKMTEVASAPTDTEIIQAEDAKLFVDDKKSRSDLECFVHEEYFVPKTEEHLIRPPLAPEEKRTEAGIVMGSLNYP